MSETTKIRPFTRADTDVFLSLIDAHADFEKKERPTGEARERLIHDALGERRRYSAFLATIDERDVGYAMTYEGYSSFQALPTLYMEDIFVFQEYRGRGFGGDMLQYLINEASARGCARMEWMVADWNDGAIGFYESHGAVRYEGWHTYRLEEDLLDRFSTLPRKK